MVVWHVCLTRQKQFGNDGYAFNGLEVHWKVAEDWTQKVRPSRSVPDTSTVSITGIPHSSTKWSNASENQIMTNIFSMVVGNGECSSVGINILPIAVSAKRHTKYIILERVYRPPVDKYCIEYPGGVNLWLTPFIGLIEKGETKEEAALRELREETGLSGAILPNCETRLIPVCSGTGSESTCLIPVMACNTGVI